MAEVRLDRVGKVYDNGHVAVSDASFHAADGEGERPAGPGFMARLDYIEPVGNEVFLNLRFAQRDLVVRLPPRPLPAPGSLVRPGFSPAKLHCFDARSGLRISSTHTWRKGPSATTDIDAR